MMSWPPLLAQALLLVGLLSFLLPRRLFWPAAMGLFAFSVWYGGQSFAAAMRALWGDPSITTLQLLILAIAGRAPTAFARGWRAPTLIAVFSLLFYTLALGVGDFDPYRLGFHPVLLLTLLALPALLLWWRGQPLWLWLLAFDLLAFAAGLLESTNFWDYLTDPLLALACIILAVRNYIISRKLKLTIDPGQPS
jgi:hypothetical protein